MEPLELGKAVLWLLSIACGIASLIYRVPRRAHR
jgi:hypothetical protein